jgi:hypothetical protein
MAETNVIRGIGHRKWKPVPEMAAADAGNG